MFPNFNPLHANLRLQALPYRSAERMQAVEAPSTWVRLIPVSSSGQEGAKRLMGMTRGADEAILRALLRVYAKHGALVRCFDALPALSCALS